LSREPGRAAVAAAFASAGLPVFSIADRAALSELARVSDPEAVQRYRLLDSAGAVVAAFPYDFRGGPGNPEDDPEENPGDYPDAGGPPPYLSVGAFAAWNRYAALSRLLLGAGRVLAADSGLPARDFRAIVNSRLPEKRLAVIAGLGFTGRSSLVVTDAYGPACLIGALLLPPGYPLTGDALPFDAARCEAASVPGAGCGSCQACVRACPTGAIDPGSGGIDTARCIQYWTTRPGEVPRPVREAWGSRLYGCDVCVASCPRSVRVPSADTLVQASERRPGYRVSAPFIESASDAEIKAFFRKTALGMSWIGAAELRRNAAMAAVFRDTDHLTRAVPRITVQSGEPER